MFRFRLQRLLDYRQHRVEQFENVVQQLQHRLQQEVARLQALQAESHQQQAYLAGMATIRGEDLHMWRRYYHGLEEHITRQQGVVEEATQVLTAKQQELVTARQEEKMLADMADKAQQRYLCTLARQEQQLLDEIAIARACHGHSTDTA